MEGFLQHLLVFHMAAWLCLAQQQVLLPPELGRYQQEMVPQQEIAPRLPEEFLQKEVPPPSLLALGEPVFSPRGRKPAWTCGDQASCPFANTSPLLGDSLPDFPPGQPSRANIGSICLKHRKRPSYGPHNLPQTGFSHLSRQGKAITSIEAGFIDCCSQTDRLLCAQHVWKNGLNEFCEEEFSIKTKHYPCCKKTGSAREACFASAAPQPSYDSVPSVQVQLPEVKSAQVPKLGSAQTRNRNSPLQLSKLVKCNSSLREKLQTLSFPPGEPTDSCIQNICRLRKFRPVYSRKEIPCTGFGWFQRQAKAINQVENEFKKCCKSENVSCAHDAWEEILSDFCEQEVSVKTKHHECCKEEDRATMLNCFASKAPHPSYDKELAALDLGNVNASALDLLCGNAKLLTKQKHLPLLVKSLTGECCVQPGKGRLQCALEQKKSFIELLCSVKKGSWKDSQRCCSREGDKRARCFNLNYLQNVSIATAGARRADEED